jgi:hypothetical protein
MVNPKGEVIARCQKEGLGTPEFRVKTKGPKHEPHFVCEVFLAENLLGSGEGNTKKRAERIAAEAALEWLGREQMAQSNTKPSPSPATLGFEGPWPIFPEVLAASLQTANSRVNAKLEGESAIKEVINLGLQLYKGALEQLGEVIEEEEA